MSPVAPPRVNTDSLSLPVRAVDRAAGSGRVRDAGDDAGHDDERDAVADAVLVDLLAEPHQEHGADGHGQDGGEPEPVELNPSA